jgi:hypothetical protein
MITNCVLRVFSGEYFQSKVGGKCTWLDLFYISLLIPQNLRAFALVSCCNYSPGETSGAEFCTEVLSGLKQECIVYSSVVTKSGTKKASLGTWLKNVWCVLVRLQAIN